VKEERKIMQGDLLVKSDTNGEFNILKSDDLIIGGYASIEVVDKQNDLITLSALEEAVEKYMESKKYRNVMSNHSNVQVGEVIESYRDKNGLVHKTEVDDVGFYVVIKLRDDIEKAKEISRGIRKGTLRSFSIGGQALSKRKKSNEELGKYNEIDKLELHEVTICEKGINPEAKFDILKEERDTMSERLDATLNEINELMKQVNALKKEETPEEEKAEYMDYDKDMEMADSDEEMEMADSEEEKGDYGDKEKMGETHDSEKKGRTGPEGFVEAGLMGEESQGKKLPQAPQVGPLYKEWSNEEFSTLDLTTENVEKAYEAFKAEQLEKLAYDSLKKQFESRFANETAVRKADIARNEYDAKNEVESLREEFATLRKSLEAKNDEIIKAQTVEIPSIDVESMSWGDIHNYMAQFEE
jgi:HK97 family phage prohead protease